MKIKTKNKLNAGVVLLILGLILASSVSALIIKTEGFEDEVVDTNPVATWYTYTETEPYGYANVTNETYKAGLQSYLINESLVAVSDGYADFQLIPQYPYLRFEFWFLINATDNEHSNVSVRLMNDERTDILCMWNISNTTCNLNNNDGVLLTASIVNKTWYRASVDFNWTDDTFNGTLYDASGTILDYSNWNPMVNISAPNVDELEYINITTTVDKSTWFAVDGFTLNKAGYEDAEYGTSAWWTFLIITIMIVLLVYWLATRDAPIDAKVLIGIAISVIMCLALITASL